MQEAAMFNASPFSSAPDGAGSPVFRAPFHGSECRRTGRVFSRRRRSNLAMALLPLAFAIAACGGSGSSTTPTPTTWAIPQAPAPWRP